MVSGVREGPDSFVFASILTKESSQKSREFLLKRQWRTVFMQRVVFYLLSFNTVKSEIVVNVIPKLLPEDILAM